jgi:hypothetical protein
VDIPLDIVGDVHGEIDALRSLLANLGYDWSLAFLDCKISFASPSSVAGNTYEILWC